MLRLAPRQTSWIRKYNTDVRSLLVSGLMLLGAQIVNSRLATAQNQEFPVYPKYQILGVVYAPPGSASSVTYGNSSFVGSSNSLTFTSSSDNVQSTSQTTGFSLFGFGSSTTTTTSNSWGEASTSQKTYNMQTTTGNSVTTMGPVSSSLGVNHDNDIIYIWLNPVVLAKVVATGANNTPPYSLNWGGLQFNSCDLTDIGDQLNFLQLMNGCDPNQYPYPDIVGIPVWCLKNPYYPGQSCAQWQPFISRSWELTPWGTDSNGLALGPGLTLQDLADILRSDPFITQTIAPDNYSVDSYCHPTYGVNFDPNDNEIILDSRTFPTTYLRSGVTWPANFCGNAGLNMSRFDPYGTVQYPVPGPNGQAQTYSGNFTYSTSSASGSSATRTSSYSYNQNTTSSFSFEASFAPLLGVPGAVFASNLSAGLSFSFSNGNGYSYSSAQTNTNTSTSGTSNSAAYSITGPQASDNYTGPVVFDVYRDDIFGTFAFYSNQQRQFPPIVISPIAVTSTANFGSVAVGSASSAQPITLTNTAPYLLTMVAPAVTFGDPGFQIVSGSDNCSNQQLGYVGNPQGLPTSCTMQIQFVPVLSDAPNTIQASYPIHANLIAAGTENVSSWQNILVTSTGVIVNGTALPGSSTAGATMTPSTFTFASELSGTPTLQTQVFSFKNYYSIPVTLSGSTSTAGSGFTLSDAIDYSISPDSCSGSTVASLGTCTFTLRYLPVGSPAALALNTKVTVFSKAQNGVPAIPLAFAGASGPLTHIGLGVSPGSVYFNEVMDPNGCHSCSPVTVTLTNFGTFPVTGITSSGTNGFFGGTCGTIAVNGSCSVGVSFGGSSCTVNTSPCQYSGSVSWTGTSNGVQVGASVSAGATVVVCPVICASPTIAFAGAEQTQTVTTPAKYGKATITIGGAVSTPFTGTRHISLTVGGFKATASYDQTATSLTVAKALAAAANGSGSPVKATVSGDIITLRSKTAGAAGNLAFTGANSGDFTISPHSSSLSGGADEVTTTKYDGGTVNITVGSVSTSSRWGQTSTPQTIATAIATSLNSKAHGAFTATVIDNTVTITLPSGGNGSTPNVTVNVNDTKGFTPPSFAATTGG